MSVGRCPTDTIEGSAVPGTPTVKQRSVPAPARHQIDGEAAEPMAAFVVRARDRRQTGVGVTRGGREKRRPADVVVRQSVERVDV